MVKLFNNKNNSVVTSVIISLLLISVGINIYQHNKVKESKVDIINLSKQYMSMHEGMFYNAIFASGSSIAKNFKDIESLNSIIEEVQKAEIYYEDAKYTENYLGAGHSGIQVSLLINGYIAELKDFRGKLIINESITDQDINNATAVIGDLKIIAEWLGKKHSNNDFTLYGDKDFYDNVYGKLSSNVKTIFNFTK